MTSSNLIAAPASVAAPACSFPLALALPLPAALHRCRSIAAFAGHTPEWSREVAFLEIVEIKVW